MGMSRIVKWRGSSLTKADLLEFLGEISAAPEDLRISIEKEPYGDHPSDPGGTITLQCELPRERTIQKD